MPTAPEQLRRLAREGLKTWVGVEPYTRRHGRIERSIPVEHPRGLVALWFVPVAIGDRLAGYFLFDPDGRLQGYSSFMRVPDRLEALPDLDSWIDARRIREVAARNARGRELGEPFLTYDVVPSRLTWAVPLRSDGDEIVYVTGDFTYSAPLDQQSTG